jgi:hypothetical protein
MSDILDGYAQAYADKLWALLPEVYRAQDTDQFGANGPLREIVNRIGAQAANVRRNIDRLWEDQSIETCDDWVIPYIGDLLATNPIAGLDPRGQRLDVANTISYRRRKGTLGVLEQIANNITGWDAKVVEFFRRLGRTRHGLDPPIGLPLVPGDATAVLQQSEGLVGARTRTGIGGCADLRDPYGASHARTAFDEFFYTADLRANLGMSGWYDIPALGVFIWRLKSFAAGPVTPVAVAGCSNWFTFDPTGRDVPLFAAQRGANSFGDNWVPLQECQVATPISQALLDANLADTTAPVDLYFESEQTPWVIAVEDGGGTILPAAALTLRPERGRYKLLGPQPPAVTFARYNYGFSSEIGAGAYDRRIAGAVVPAPSPAKLLPPGTGALAAPGAIPGSGTLAIPGSLTRNNAGPAQLTGALTIQAVAPTATVAAPLAAGPSCPVIRLLPNGEPWVFHGTAGSALVLDGLLVTGGDVVLTGIFDSVLLNCCTFDPGTAASGAALASPPALYALSADNRPLRPTRLWIEASVTLLQVQRCILGGVRTRASGVVETMSLSDTIIQALPDETGGLAFDLPDGTVELSRCTVIGPSRVHRADISECILRDIMLVDDTQHGCVRFSAWASGSVLPRQFQSVRVAAGAGLFTSTDYGQPGYAQLLPRADTAILPGSPTSGAHAPTISAGAADGSEMGVFAREQAPTKLRGLITKLGEYMPAGLTPVPILVT